MADSGTTPLTASPAVGGVNHDDESRMLLGFLQYQRDSVLKIVEGLPEDAWQTPVVSSGWTVAGMLAHLGGADATGSRTPSRPTRRAPTSSPATARGARSLMKCSASPPCPRPRAGPTFTVTRSTPPG